MSFNSFEKAPPNLNKMTEGTWKFKTDVSTLRDSLHEEKNN